MMLIGLLGGMSWESTALYYRIMNEATREALGDLHSARILMHSVDFEPIQKYQHEGKWGQCARILVDAAKSLKAGGASFLVIATNTMHKLADEIEEGSGLPVLHIADPTGEAIVSAGYRKVGLLATRFTMEEAFLPPSPGKPLPPRSRRSRRGGTRRYSPYHLRGALPGRDPRDLGGPVPPDHRPYEMGRMRGRDPRLHRDRHDRFARTSALPVFDTTTLHARPPSR
jgi:hypothetical protein